MLRQFLGSLTIIRVSVSVTGRAGDGTVCRLDVDGDAADLSTMVNLTLPDGRTPRGSGSRGPALPPGRRVSTSWGSGDDGPRTLIVCVSAEVRAVVVRLSNGEREDVVLHGDPGVLGARVGVVVYPRELDVHRIDLVDADGRPLAEAC